MPPPSGAGSYGSPFSQPSGTAPGFSSPYGGAPNIGAAPGYAAPGYAAQPPVLFPNGFGGAPWNYNWPQPEPGRYMRLFQDIRLRYTWLSGDGSPGTMQAHDVELGTTVNFPNFLFSGRPLHVSPVFTFHFWDGPDAVQLDPVFPDMPSQAYSALLDFSWQPMITPQFGGDVDVSVGVFSDFNAVTTDSLRFQGTGLGVLNLTPAVTLKAGVTYLDRLDIKLLPAFGVLWQPNPQTRFDIFFPRPKLARYLGTLGNTDIWWYVTGEYGGGSWTLDTAPVVPLPPPGGFASRSDRRVDINDIRVGGGLEWTCPSGMRAFVEAGYVFDREIVYASDLPDRYSLDDAFMLRGGLAY